MQTSDTCDICNEKAKLKWTKDGKPYWMHAVKNRDCFPIIKKNKQYMIRTVHIKSGRDHINRPENICNICNGKIRLCWDTKHTVFWRHAIPNYKCSIIPNFDYTYIITEELVKDYLLTGLSNGITIVFNKNGVEEKLPDNCVEYDKNVYCYKEGNVYFPSDIIGINSLGEAVFAIQLYSPQRDHTIQNTMIPVFTVNLIDVINNFDLLILPAIITLTDCSKFTINKIIPIREIFYSERINMAVRMGYLKIDKAYNCRAQCLLDQCEKGFYFLDKKIWNTTGIEDVGAPIIYKCFRCTAKSKTGLCEKCSIEIIKENASPREKINVSKNIIDIITFSLGWLNLVKGNYQLGDPCSICNRKFITEKENKNLEHFWEKDKNYVKCYTTWFGDNKCCCLACIHLSLKIQKLMI